jgi:RimJ/RimL family protein N-acetyltransferase
MAGENRGMKTSIPVIQTERLTLRGHELKDFALCRAMWADEITTKYTIGKPSTEQQTWMRVLAYRGHWELMGFGYWAIEEKKSGHYVGELGFADFKREITPSIQGQPEMGWALAPSAHGQGYATEAITAALGWADQNLKADKTVCIINPGNQRSIKLAGEFGFKTVTETNFMGAQVTLFSRARASR